MNNFDRKLTEKITDSLVKTFNPKLIYLFGSHAWGTPGSSSDYDFFVVVESSDCSMADRIRTGLTELEHLNLPLDLLVYTVDEFNSKSEHPSTLMHKISRKGVKLYEAA